MIPAATAIGSVLQLALEVGPTVLNSVDKLAPFIDTILRITQRGQNVSQDDLDQMLAQLRSQSDELQAIKTE